MTVSLVMADKLTSQSGQHLATSLRLSDLLNTSREKKLCWCFDSVSAKLLKLFEQATSPCNRLQPKLPWTSWRENPTLLCLSPIACVSPFCPLAFDKSCPGLAWVKTPLCSVSHPSPVALSQGCPGLAGVKTPLCSVSHPSPVALSQGCPGLAGVKTPLCSVSHPSPVALSQGCPGLAGVKPPLCSVSHLRLGQSILPPVAFRQGCPGPSGEFF